MNNVNEIFTSHEESQNRTHAAGVNPEFRFSIMKSFLLLFIILGISSCDSDNNKDEGSIEKLLIRSPYADENLRIIHEVKNLKHCRELHALLLAAESINPPHASSPQYRFEFTKSNGSSLIYDFF